MVVNIIFQSSNFLAISLLLLSWSRGLLQNMRICSFAYSKTYHKMQSQEFLIDFLNDSTVREDLQVISLLFGIGLKQMEMYSAGNQHDSPMNAESTSLFVGDIRWYGGRNLYSIIVRGLLLSHRFHRRAPPLERGRLGTQRCGSQTHNNQKCNELHATASNAVQSTAHWSDGSRCD